MYVEMHNHCGDRAAAARLKLLAERLLPEMLYALGLGPDDLARTVVHVVLWSSEEHQARRPPREEVELTVQDLREDPLPDDPAQRVRIVEQTYDSISYGVTAVTEDGEYADLPAGEVIVYLDVPGLRALGAAFELPEHASVGAILAHELDHAVRFHLGENLVRPSRVQHRLAVRVREATAQQAALRALRALHGDPDVGDDAAAALAFLVRSSATQPSPYRVFGGLDATRYGQKEPRAWTVDTPAPEDRDERAALAELLHAPAIAYTVGEDWALVRQGDRVYSAGPGSSMLGPYLVAEIRHTGAAARGGPAHDRREIVLVPIADTRATVFLPTGHRPGTGPVPQALDPDSEAALRALLDRPVGPEVDPGQFSAEAADRDAADYADFLAGFARSGGSDALGGTDPGRTVGERG